MQWGRRRNVPVGPDQPEREMGGKTVWEEAAHGVMAAVKCAGSLGLQLGSPAPLLPKGPLHRGTPHIKRRHPIPNRGGNTSAPDGTCHIEMHHR